MREVLLVCKEVAMENEAAAGVADGPTLSRFPWMKPGVQAIANTAPDLPPVAGKHPTFARDHE